MSETKESIVKFVKIVERHPEIYNPGLEAYRMRPALESAWEKIVACVKAELNEDCTVEELKTKWKGIRSSYNRFKNKLYQDNSESANIRKYYLYDSLRFLDPFVRPKGASIQNHNNQQEDINEHSFNYVDADNSECSFDFNPSECTPSDIKREVIYDMQENNEEANTRLFLDSEKDIYSLTASKRKKYENQHVNNMSVKKTNIEDNEDLQFFRSILPDIKHFTNKEKRKLKMGILQLIDDIEDTRINVDIHISSS